MSEEIWISTDQAEDVAASVRHAIRSFAFTEDDEKAWKWVILALHSALQGACVCHLLTTAEPVGAVTKENAIEWLKYFEESKSDHQITPPKTHLMNLPDLLRAVRKSNSAGDGSNTVGVALSDAELVWLKRIHDDIRNQFVHFAPLGWSIDVGGVSDLATLIARLVQQILDFGWGFRHKDSVWRAALTQNLQTLRSMD
jgi:hypothetical protein